MKRYIRANYRSMDVEDWSMTDYFEYLVDQWYGDIEDACGEIETAWGNEDLPPCVSNMDWRDIEDEFIAWAEKESENTDKYDIPSSSNTWYRCVEKGSDIYKFKWYELGIHCGSLDQSEYVNDTKYGGEGDIYKITLSPDVSFSNVVNDQAEWPSIESVFEILTEGFMVDISFDTIRSGFRSGRWNKKTAADYILDVTGDENAVVVYSNEIENPEQNIVILNESSIQRYEKIN